MRKSITAILFALTLSSVALAGGCGDKSKKDAASCDKVADHFIKHAPPEFKKQLGDKAELVKSCEKKTSLEERKCILETKDFKGIMGCRKSKKG